MAAEPKPEQPNKEKEHDKDNSVDISNSADVQHVRPGIERVHNATDGGSAYVYRSATPNHGQEVNPAANLEIGEPAAANARTENGEPEISNARTQIGEPTQMREPLASRTEQGSSEIGEPLTAQISEPSQLGLEVKTDILSNHTRLWRLGAYVDRHGKRRARRVLRFVADPPPTVELGQVTAELAEELKARPGRGRWGTSRDEAEQFRRIAEHVAVAFRRDKRLRRSGGVLHVPGRPIYQTAERGDMPATQDDAQWPDMPNVLM